MAGLTQDAQVKLNYVELLFDNGWITRTEGSALARGILGLPLYSDASEQKSESKEDNCDSGECDCDLKTDEEAEQEELENSSNKPFFEITARYHLPL